MKHLIGMESNAYPMDNEFGIDFATFKKYGVISIDYRGIWQAKDNPFFKLPEEQFIDFFKRLKKELDKYGLIANQTHALWDPEYEYTHQDEDIFFYYQRPILAASIMKTKYIVMHPEPIKGHYLWDKVPYEDIYEANKEFINRLLPLIEKHNVYLAIENLPFLSIPEFFSPSGTLKLVNDFNNNHIVMCLDTGHFNIYKEDIYEFLIKGKDKIQCLHIHDNQGDTDAHAIPYTGTFNWKMFIKGLKDINYQGVLSLETLVPVNKYSQEEYQKRNNHLLKVIKDMRDELDKE